MAKTSKKTAKKTLKPGPDISADSADNLKKKLSKTTEEGTTDLCLDFAEVKTVDPVGLSIIVAAHNTLKNAGGKLTLINVADEFFTFFKTLQLDQDLELQQ